MCQVNSPYTPSEHQLGAGAVLTSWLACAAVMSMLVAWGGLI